MKVGKGCLPPTSPALHYWRSDRFLLALSLVATGACSDSKGPTDLKGQISLRPGVSVPVSVRSQVVTSFRGRSVTDEYRSRRTITVVKERGKAKVETVADQSRPLNRPRQIATFARASKVPPNGARFAQVESDGVNFTPVLAVTAGDYTGNFEVVDTDSAGNKIRTVTSSVGSAPFSDVKVYQNGALIGAIHSEWTPVYGGYILNFQKQVNYAADAQTPALVVMTSVSTSYAASYQPLAAMKSEMTDFLSTALRGVGKGIECAVTPKTAFAQYRSGDRYCWQEGVVMAGVATAIALTLWTWTRMPRSWWPSSVEITAFHIEMAGLAWTFADYGKCMRDAKLAGRRP